MAFPREQISELLVKCHRRCCICHRFCGVKIETDHILPKDEGGDDSINNAIPVCFECHADIHSYNDKHPRGRKFLPDELQRHKSQWLKICQNHPEILIAPTQANDVGPLQALIDELTFNSKISTRLKSQEQGGKFHNNQFLHAINQGAIAVLKDEIKNSIMDAYAAMEAANEVIAAAWMHPRRSKEWTEGTDEAKKRIIEAAPKIETAAKELLCFLSRESEGVLKKEEEI